MCLVPCRSMYGFTTVSTGSSRIVIAFDDMGLVASLVAERRETAFGGSGIVTSLPIGRPVTALAHGPMVASLGGEVAYRSNIDINSGAWPVRGRDSCQIAFSWASLTS